MKLSLDELNENQRSAVLWNDGPLLVLAGPGSGKTRVLTYRIARILQEQSESSVLALTFTNMAATEMRDRLDALMGMRAERTHLCTFHSFAADILRQHGSHLGLSPDFVLLKIEEDRIGILEQAIDSLGKETPGIPGDRKNLLTLIDRQFSDGFDSQNSTTSHASTPPWLPLLFKKYCDCLLHANRMDFGSLLHFSKKLLTERPGICRVLRMAWTHVCVDEFQDTNKAQYELLAAILGDQKPNLFVVADDDQIIYQWNGASPEQLQKLRTSYAMEVIQLPENFRCPSNIIVLANNLISNNLHRSEGKLPQTTSRAAELKDSIWVGVYDSEQLESDAIPAEIKRRNLNPNDCAVLARSTKLLQSAARSIESAGMNAHLVQRKNEFESLPIRWLYNILRLANGRHDREILRRVIVAWKDLTGLTSEVDDVDAYSALFGGDFLRSWCEFYQAKTIGNGASELFVKVSASLVNRLEFLSLIDWFMAEGYKPWMDDPLVIEEISTWKELHGELIREHGEDNTTLNLYLQELDLKSKANVKLPNAVQCLTIHSSKGLEFKHVFLVGMAEEVCPSYHAVKKGASSREIEEERRNCFVAITRVQETLTLMRSRRYNGYTKQPSRFLAEMGLDSK